MTLDLQSVMQAFDRAGDYLGEHAKPARPRPVVTISRSMGSLGTEIGLRVAERLGVHCYSHEVLEEIGARLHASPKTLQNLHEAFGAGSGSWLAALLTGEQLERDDYLKTLIVVMRRLHGLGGVIVGRGGHVILRDRVCLRVRVTASDAVAAERLMVAEGIGKNAALDRIQKSTKAREGYLKRMFHESYDQPNAFDLRLDTSRLDGMDWAADAILGAVPQIWPGVQPD